MYSGICYVTVRLPLKGFTWSLILRSFMKTCLEITLTAYWLTYCMEQSPSWKANRFSASQEIPRTLGKPEVHYHIHKWPPSVSILSQINPLHPSPPPPNQLKISCPFSAAQAVPKDQSRSKTHVPFRNKTRFYDEELLAPRPNPHPRWRTTPCRLSATAYSLFS